MRCHYEVLGVARDANDDEIKRTYRKLALQTHPDKHPEDHEHYTVLFREIQAAYEVLSDPQERSWYDRHREAILRGDEEYVDDTLDLMHFFNPGVYSGFGDDEHGFYGVYSSAFQKIAEEDEPFVDDGIYEVPSFGNSQSPFEDIVKPFYGFWLSYCTKKTYVWAEKYDIRQAPNRPTQRLMEKENKKLRDAAKRKRNEEVRALVAFVRKRDKRVHDYRKKLEQLQKLQKESFERKRVEEKKERQKQMEDYQEQEWVAFDKMKNQLEDIEKHFDKEFGEECGYSGDEDEHVERFYCVACDKVFKSEKALANHEKSKKHKESIEIIKNEMEEDLIRDLHIGSDVDLDTLLREEENSAVVDGASEPRYSESARFICSPQMQSVKNADVSTDKDLTFEEYSHGIGNQSFGENCYDSIRLAKQRKPTRQGSHDYKEKKKKGKADKFVDSSSSGDEKNYDKDSRDLLARDSLALPRKKTSKTKQLRIQAEKRRTEDSDAAPFLDASLGESSVFDSLRINKIRASTKDKISKLKGMGEIAEIKSSDDSRSGTDDAVTSGIGCQGESYVSHSSDASLSNLESSESSGEDPCGGISNGLDMGDEGYLKTPVLGHSPLTDSIRIGKVKMTPHGKAALKQKRRKSRDQDDLSEPGDGLEGPGKSVEADGGRQIYLCSVCGSEYPSRNKLFEHIKAERHAAVKEGRDKSKRKKDKSKQ